MIIKILEVIKTIILIIALISSIASIINNTIVLLIGKKKNFKTEKERKSFEELQTAMNLILIPQMKLCILVIIFIKILMYIITKLSG